MPETVFTQTEVKAAVRRFDLSSAEAFERTLTPNQKQLVEDLMNAMTKGEIRYADAETQLAGLGNPHFAIAATMGHIKSNATQVDEGLMADLFAGMCARLL